MNLDELPKATKPFKNHLNQRYSKQLFYEQWTMVDISDRIIRPCFTLNADRPGLINFGRTYVNDCDPTGYTTAMKLLGEFDYFNHLLKADWFRAAKASWDAEMEAKLYAEGLAKIRELAKGEDAKALAAAKYLANKEFKQGNAKTRRGRPSAIEIEGALKEGVREQKEIENDLARIRAVN